MKSLNHRLLSRCLLVWSLAAFAVSVARAEETASSVNLTAGAGEAPPITDPAPVSFWEDLAGRPTLLGDWWGAKPYLSQYGVDVSLSYVTNMAGNPVGGMSHGFTETDSTGLNIAVDFEQMAGWEGLTGFVSMAYRQGTSLALRRIGSMVSVQQVYGGQTFHLINLYLQQDFGSMFSFKAGRLAQFDDFANDLAFGYFMNNAFDGQPVGFFFQGPFNAYPVTTWGAIAKFGIAVDEKQGFYAFAGAYGADTEVGDNKYHGTDFSFDFNKGANVMVEVGYKRNWGNQSSAEGGLATKAAIGGWWFTGDFDVHTMVPGMNTQKSGIGGFYYVLHQGLYREDQKVQIQPGTLVEGDETYWGSTDFMRSAEQGLFVFATGQFAGASTSTFDVFVNFGAYYRGLLPGRDRDVLSFGYYHGYISDELSQSQVNAGQTPQSYEAAFELGYRYNVTDYFYLQPNIQYVMNPGGSGSIDDALVLGIQIQVDF